MKRCILAVAVLTACLAVPLAAADASPPPETAAVSTSEPLILAPIVVERPLLLLQVAASSTVDSGPGPEPVRERSRFSGYGKLAVILIVLGLIAWWGITRYRKRDVLDRHESKEKKDRY